MNPIEQFCLQYLSVRSSIYLTLLGYVLLKELMKKNMLISWAGICNTDSQLLCQWGYGYASPLTEDLRLVNHMLLCKSWGENVCLKAELTIKTDFFLYVHFQLMIFVGWKGRKSHVWVGSGSECSMCIHCWCKSIDNMRQFLSCKNMKNTSHTSKKYLFL